MRTIILKIFIFTFLLNLSLYSQDKICLTNGEWPPYLSEKLPHNGFASHVVKEAFKSVDIEVEYIFLPWKRAFLSAKLGVFNNKTCHGTLVWVYNEERAKSFIYTDVVINDNQVLYSLKENPVNWKKIEDLKGKIIGGTLHTYYPVLAEAENKGILILEKAGPYKKLFEKLLAKRIDAIPYEKNVGDFFIRTELSREDKNRIFQSDTALSNKKFHVIFSRKITENEEYVKLFNKGLKTIKENGTYDKLLDGLNKGLYDKPLN